MLLLTSAVNSPSLNCSSTLVCFFWSMPSLSVLFAWPTKRFELMPTFARRSTIVSIVSRYWVKTIIFESFFEDTCCSAISASFSSLG